MKIRFTTRRKFVAAFLIGGALGWLVAEPVWDPNSVLNPATVIPSPLSWWRYLTMPLMWFELLDSESLFGLRAFLLGGTIGCVILLVAPILFNFRIRSNTDSEGIGKCDY